VTEKRVSSRPVGLRELVVLTMGQEPGQAFTIRQLADQVGGYDPSVYQVLVRLERRGLVHRSRLGTEPTQWTWVSTEHLSPFVRYGSDAPEADLLCSFCGEHKRGGFVGGAASQKDALPSVYICPDCVRLAAEALSPGVQDPS